MAKDVKNRVRIYNVLDFKNEVHVYLNDSFLSFPKYKQVRFAYRYALKHRLFYHCILHDCIIFKRSA